MRLLRRGMKGEDVLRWQEFLNAQGFPVGSADGDFGSRTFQATVQFQRRHGLGSDGVVGNNTLNQARQLGFDEGGGATPVAGDGATTATGDGGASPTPEGGGTSSAPADVPASLGPFNQQALAQIMPNLKADKRALYYPFLVAAMVEFDITTPLRIAAFVAQLAHESAEFRFMEEIWGPTAAQKRYEGRKDLGNTQPGDGFRFKGRGPIQITGRANYTKYGNLLGIDLVANPALAATPEVGFRTAGLYWKMNNCNALADQQRFVAITKAINGGTNGLQDREKYYDRAKRVLGIATRGLPPPSAETPEAAEEEAARGFTRGLDEPGETTPTAAERNAEQASGAGGETAAAAAGASKSANAGASEASGKKGAAGKASTKQAGAQKAGARKGAARKGAARKGATKKGAGKKAAAKKSAASRTAATKSAAGRGATWSAAKKSAKSAAKKSGASRGAGPAAKKSAKKPAGGSTKAAAAKKSSRTAKGAGKKAATKKGAGGTGARKGASKKGARGSKSAKGGARRR
ncbi:MAG TPA: peptidoglycan-binding protein [Pyrinomonadaceae bacterium]|nr:peptidoglycan-binding protein [Pyrinomonadaceae bacterium]